MYAFFGKNKKLTLKKRRLATVDGILESYCCLKIRILTCHLKQFRLFQTVYTMFVKFFIVCFVLKFDYFYYGFFL